MGYLASILGLQSVSRDVADNVSNPRRLDPTMELITYSFVLYLQHGRHDVKCKPSIGKLVNRLQIYLRHIVYQDLSRMFPKLHCSVMFDTAIAI